MRLLFLLLTFAAFTTPALADTVPSMVVLPPGVEAVWDLSKAYHQTTSTRERICLNGLWQWQPAAPQSKQVPGRDWGYFKVPGCWPGITDYMQKDCQTVYSHPSWSSQKLAELSAAWYQREFIIPSNWNGRRILLSVDYLNSYAAVYLDDSQVGEIRFPGGAIELTSALKNPGPHKLALLVVALPLKAVMLSYTDSASAREQKGFVARRGLCGDVYLVSRPSGPRFTDLRLETSVRKKSIALHATTEALVPDAKYRVHAKILDGTKNVKEFTSSQFLGKDLDHGRIDVTENWMPDQLWDIHTPTNVYTFEVSLLDPLGTPLDATWPVRFGFRELWIDGRDFYLNGTRLFLSAVPLDNAQVSADLATYARARESLERLKSFGINFVYTHNYGCEPGAHLGFEEILKAADDVGMLVSFSQPHFSHYDWKAGDADQSNGYATHAAYYVRAAQNHPSVVMYSMSHNATGYDEDMNPDLIDGIHDARDSWALKNVALAKRAETLIHSLDPSRIVYHHASGNLGSMHAINFYPNFVPIQELSDWFGHWSTAGIKPAFMCEYGAPFTWDWTMYRGFYKGQREFGSAAVPWEFCLAEWNAQFLGDKAYEISDAEKANLRWEARQFRDGKLWHRWDYPVDVGSSRLTERYPVFAMYLKDNWRAFRTWGVSAISPWEFEHFWKLRDGVDRSRKEFTVNWQELQRPGFSPDYEDQRYERMDLAYDRSDWVPTVAAQVLMQNNGPLLAYLAGKPAAFTSKDHLFQPGESIEKQLVIINNSRITVTADYHWSLERTGFAKITGTDTRRVSIPAGQQERIPLKFDVPSLAPDAFSITAEVRFSNGEIQHDSFPIEIVPKPTPTAHSGNVAVFDPKGDTTQLLERLGWRTDRVGPDATLTNYDILIVGKAALTRDSPAPDIGHVKDGLKVLIFEQGSEVLEKRFGFRVEEYGLRQVFPRVPDHPALAGLRVDQLRDWRGEATLLPGQSAYQPQPRYGPTVEWCGIRVPHLWRCGNRGNVASVLIEKPARGDFLPIVEGGFSLQYSPLLEYHEGKGIVVFCQLDVTSRTEPEPAAEILIQNLLAYSMNWKPTPHREVCYVGDSRGNQHLESVGITSVPFATQNLSTNTILVAGPNSGNDLSPNAAPIATWLKTGGTLLTLGLPQDELQKFLPPGSPKGSPAPGSAGVSPARLPVSISTTNLEHISTWFEPFPFASFGAGLSPADLHNRDPRTFPVVTGGARVFGDGILAQAETEAGQIVLCQIVPWDFSDTPLNLKRTHRRISFLLSRLLANLGATSSTPLLERFHERVSDPSVANHYLSGLYLDTPEEWDDPYRHFRW